MSNRPIHSCSPTRYTVPGREGYDELPGWLMRDLLDPTQWSEELDYLRSALGMPTHEPSFHGSGGVD